MMTYDEAVSALQSMTMFVPGWDICQSCGHEHNCQTEGCAILRETLAMMEGLYKDAAARGCGTCISRHKPITEEPCRSCHGDVASLSNWQWRGVQQKEATP